jgi:hypothetical protein
MEDPFEFIRGPSTYELDGTQFDGALAPDITEVVHDSLPYPHRDTRVQPLIAILNDQRSSQWKLLKLTDLSTSMDLWMSLCAYLERNNNALEILDMCINNSDEEQIRLLCDALRRPGASPALKGINLAGNCCYGTKEEWMRPVMEVVRDRPLIRYLDVGSWDYDQQTLGNIAVDVFKNYDGDLKFLDVCFSEYGHSRRVYHLMVAVAHRRRDRVVAATKKELLERLPVDIVNHLVDNFVDIPYNEVWLRPDACDLVEEYGYDVRSYSDLEVDGPEDDEEDDLSEDDEE